MPSTYWLMFPGKIAIKNAAAANQAQAQSETNAQSGAAAQQQAQQIAKSLNPGDKVRARESASERAKQ